MLTRRVAAGAAGADGAARRAAPEAPPGGPAAAAASTAAAASVATPETVLRPARADDALCLSVLAMQVFLDTYATNGIRAAIAREVRSTFAPPLFARHLASPAMRLTLAERAGHVVGFAHVVLGAAHALAPPGVPAELLRLYVQAPFTGTGLGSRLLAAAEAEAAAAGATLLWLTTWAHNHRALAFYAGRGYADHGATWHVAEGQAHPNRLFARGLAAAAAR